MPIVIARAREVIWRGWRLLRTCGSPGVETRTFHAASCKGAYQMFVSARLGVYMCETHCAFMRVVRLPVCARACVCVCVARVSVRAQVYSTSNPWTPSAATRCPGARCVQGLPNNSAPSVQDFAPVHVDVLKQARPHGGAAGQTLSWCPSVFEEGWCG